MGAVLTLKYAIYLALRSVGRFVPPDLGYFVLWPLAALRSLPLALNVKEWPGSTLSGQPQARQPGFLTRWRWQMTFHQRWLTVLWSDLWSEPRWRSRFRANGLDRLLSLTADRPVIVATVHTGGMVVLNGWLARQGLGIGSILVDPLMLVRFQAMRKSRRFPMPRNSAAFAPQEGRKMVRFLEPGRVLVLQVDHPLGRIATGHWSGGTLQVSSGAFRIARMAKAAIVPVVVMDDGRWRWRVDVGNPVPAELVDAEDDQAAADFLSKELMAIAGSDPWQATDVLFRAVTPAV